MFLFLPPTIYLTAFIYYIMREQMIGQLKKAKKRRKKKFIWPRFFQSKKV